MVKYVYTFLISLIGSTYLIFYILLGHTILKILSNSPRNNAPHYWVFLRFPTHSLPDQIFFTTLCFQMPPILFLPYNEWTTPYLGGWYLAVKATIKINSWNCSNWFCLTDATCFGPHLGAPLGGLLFRNCANRRPYLCYSEQSYNTRNHHAVGRIFLILKLYNI
jgi:hypothetical protein